jgi:anthranilate/para-aminobenzoate synthase component I
MATAKEQLLSMMNPQQARLLDQQMRGQQVAQRSQGAGMLSGLVQAYTGMGDVAQRAAGITPMGANELGAIENNKQVELQKQRLLEEKQKKNKELFQQRQAAMLAVKNNPDLPEPVKKSLMIGIASGDKKAMEQAYKYNPKARYVSVGGNAFIDTLDPTREVQRNPTKGSGSEKELEKDLAKLVGFDIKNTTFESQKKAMNLVEQMRADKENGYTEFDIAKAARDELVVKPEDDDDFELPVYSIKQAEAAATASNTLFFQSQNYMRLYQDILNEPISDGLWGQVEESLKSTFGAGDRETLIKKLIGSATVIEGLKLTPTGSVSNVEYTNSLAQVPNKDDDKEVILGWLDNVTRLTSLGADFQGFKANYIRDPKNKGMSVGAREAFMKQLKKNNPEKYSYYFELEKSQPVNNALAGESTESLLEQLKGFFD